MLCNECLKTNGHHPNCPEAEDAPDSTFTVWRLGNPVDTVLRSESAMRSAASKLGFDASVVISEGEADIVNECGIVIGGCYANEGEGGWLYD